MTAVTRRGELPGQIGRRSEIGSHSPPIPPFSFAVVSVKNHGALLLWNCGLNVGAALLRGDLRIESYRRSEIGSHTRAQLAQGKLS